ncbi:hypothetical protein WN944_026298 [Citrus x changshan-huyou]|uniref:Uncharacterized protein n=1 Tax=Citrus x changshan-huyou TaxID=2935761 RepID=A0AAP0LS58_9ROSI
MRYEMRFPHLSVVAPGHDGSLIAHPSRSGYDEIIPLASVLIERAKLAQHEDEELESEVGAARQMIRMTNKRKNTTLYKAVFHGNVDVVKILTREDPGFAMYRLTAPTACAMSGLIHIIANIKLSTTDAYGTRDICFLSASLLGNILDDNLKLRGSGVEVG